jgi:hypothetical protein
VPGLPAKPAVSTNAEPYSGGRDLALDAAILLATLGGATTCGAAFTLLVGATRNANTAFVLLLLFGSALAGRLHRRWIACSSASLTQKAALPRSIIPTDRTRLAGANHRDVDPLEHVFASFN